MRIAYMLTSLGIGGAERQVIALAEHMAARGHNVALIVLRPQQSEEWSTQLSIIHLNMGRSPASLGAGLVRGRRFLRSFRPDLLHSHTYPANLVTRLLKVLAPPQLVLSTIHNVYEGGWLRMLAYRLTDPLAQHTTAVSRAAADRSVQLKAVPRRKLSVLTNAIDTDEFVSDHERRTDARVELAAGDGFIWLAAGRISPAKDYPNLLRAFAHVHAVEPQSQLWIAGEGDPSVATELHSIGAELGLNDCVRWLGLRRDIAALLDAADGFVLSSAWEGMPLVVGEAMAMQKPVVATDVGGVRELTGDTTSALVAPADSDVLSHAMLDLMRQPADARECLGRAARLRVQQHFSTTVRFAEWERLYHALLERKS